MTAVQETVVGNVVDNDDVPEFTCHIYFVLDNMTARCGIRVKDDKHRQMHLDNGIDWIRMQPEIEKCPVCEAPLCPACLRLYLP